MVRAMSEGRFSTILFNEWICITAQHEKAIARLGRQIYQGYSRKLIEDFGTIELCREISNTFAEARTFREELEDELERDALDGLNAEEARKADEIRELTQIQKTKRQLKLKFTKLLGRQALNRNLSSHRDKVKELSRELGLRAVERFQDEPLLKIRGHKALCQLAQKLGQDADKKWEDIVASNNEKGGGLTFHTTLFSFISGFASFSKGSTLGKHLFKWLKYDESEENDKLSKQYESSNTAVALRAQMEEIDEPHLDVGRELAIMQQEYEEAPDDWNLPSIESSKSGSHHPSGQSYGDPFTTDPSTTVTPEAIVDKWEPQEDTWDPDSHVDEDFLDSALDFSSPSSPPNPEPTTVRSVESKIENVETWSSQPEPENLHTGSLPQIGSFSQSSEKAGDSEQDWNWEQTTEETTENLPAPKLVSESDPFRSPPQQAKPLNPTPNPNTHPKDTEAPWAEPPQKTEHSNPFSSDKVSSNLPDRPLWTPEAAPSIDNSPWTPAPTPVSEEPNPLSAINQTAPLQQVEKINSPGTPLDNFNKPASPSTPPIKVSPTMEAGDGLLPAFPKNPTKENPKEESANIPELPTFLIDDNAPKLEILPFGTSASEKGSENEEGFIPPTPDL